ncbi:MAG: hypothetical protein N3B18_13745 [Desulfobacterota bacterium]|nr:hypothetical protein [Thermodesulfobacteriota bacterium]
MITAAVMNFTVFVCLAFVSVTAYGADNTIIPVTVSSPTCPAVRYTNGVVTAVSLADPTRGHRSELIVRCDSGTVDTLLVKATTTIYDDNGSAVPLDALRKDQRVKVKYITSSEGVHEALFIKIVK